MDTARPVVRAIAADELDPWLALPGSVDERLRSRLSDAWAEGSGGPDRTFLIERDRRPIGRVAYTTAPAASALPDVHEATVTGLWLPWDEPGMIELGAELITRSVAGLGPAVRFVDAWANPDVLPDWAERRAVFEAARLPLFQEKEGFLWSAGEQPPPDPPRRLAFRSLNEIGRAALASVMGRATAGTLDRQDQHYAALVGRDQWGVEMLAFASPEDEPSWLLASDATGAPVGYVLLSVFDEPDRGTIAHIGVVPEARGRGYVDELLTELDRHARARGMATVLSDSDTLNAPMHAALERAGHRAAATRWHVWHYRLER